jgi:hypothetical protein
VVANACASIGAQAAVLRFVELARLRTEHEFFHHSESPIVFRVSNKDLRQLHEEKALQAMIHSEDGQEILVIPSDRSGPSKGYLLLHVNRQEISDADTSLLKVFVNQAEMLYQHFASVPVEPADARLVETA